MAITCVGIIGPNQVLEKFSYEYAVYVDEVNTGQDITVYLSYGGGTLEKGKDFIAPDRMIIPSGSENAIIIISTKADYSSGNNLYIKIDPMLEGKSVCSSVISYLIEPESTDNPIGHYCGEIGFFFEPYMHSTKKASNMK